MGKKGRRKIAKKRDGKHPPVHEASKGKRGKRQMNLLRQRNLTLGDQTWLPNRKPEQGKKQKKTLKKPRKG